MLKTGMILNERYEIEKVIGEGGMAVVYKGKDHKLHREVAIKVLRPELSADEVVLSKFRKEGLNAASLSHNNIVGVYDLGRQSGSDYIVMEYIDGITLKEYIDRRKGLTNEEIFKISVKIADALKAAHTAGIIHRDIKPQNIMVTPKGVVKVTDFGIAKATSVNTMTAQGEAMGSVHYFSPEQARGQKVDTRSDLYSLGITMFEMATSRLPFEGDTPVATAMKQIHDPLPDIRTINPDIWPGMAGIIRKLTNKQPEERYQTADELLEDLKRVYQNHNYVPGGKAKFTEYIPPVQPDATQQEEPILEDDEDASRKKKLWITVGSIAGLVILLLVGYFVLFGRNNKSDTYTVPNLVGATEQEARDQASASGFTVVVDSQHYNDEYERGRIYEQDPAPGTTLNREGTIEVKLSMGSYDATTVPNLSGLTYADAVDSLVQMGLAYTIETAPSEEIEIGSVISQDPAEGTEVTESTVVTLTISTGSEEEGIEVPSLTGKTREEAATELRDAGLVLGEVSLSYHDTVPSGQVIAQDVDAGAKVAEGTAVSITISQGTPDEDAESTAANGSIIITNPLPEGTTSGQLSIDAIDSNGNSTGLYDASVTEQSFAGEGLVISYPDGTVKIRVYLDGAELFVRDVN